MFATIVLKDRNGLQGKSELITFPIIRRFSCTFSAGETVSTATNSISWSTIDIFLREAGLPPSFDWPDDCDDLHIALEIQDGEQHAINSGGFGAKAASQLLLEGLSEARKVAESVIRLILPRTCGQIARSDIIPLRLLDCPSVKTVLGLARPLQYYDGRPFAAKSPLDLPDAFAASAGGILLETSSCTEEGAIESMLADISMESQSRLSFPWLSMQETKRKTLALVEGGRRSPDLGGNGETVFKAAEALGIDMIVMDNAGHWLDGPRWGHWCKEFIPVECTEQSDHVFTARIVEILRAWGGHLDGLVTFCDHYKMPIAAAALELGLPSFAPQILDNATNKFKLSVSEGRPTYRASTFEEAAGIVQEQELQFPLIIKPSLMGFQSEGVYRVENLEDVATGMKTTDTERHGTEFVIEQYCSGPEVDINFVLCDHEVLFVDISDELPKGADVNGQQGSVDTFLELGNRLPSKLPASEIAVLRNSLHQSLLRVGLPDGVYHVEARVENSRMEYAVMNGTLDLVQSCALRERQPSAWLLEINPRPPGIMAADAVKHTYGVDYWGLGLLFALEDRRRARQLAHPFMQGPQYWCEMVFLPVNKGGICHSDDPCLELMNRRPDLARHVSYACTYFAKGQRVPGPGEGRNAWMAHINVFSRTSRAHAMEIGEAVRRELRYVII